MALPKRSNLNKIVDLLAFTGFIFLATTGVILKYILIPGSGHRYTIWGLDRHEWGDVHFWISVGFFSVLAIHLLLHWKWILFALKGKTTEYSGRRLVLGAVGFAVLILLAVAPVLSPVERTPSSSPESGNQRMNKDLEVSGDTVQQQRDFHSDDKATIQTESPQPKVEEGEGPIVFGYMTIKEVATQNNLSVEKVIELLGVNSDTPETAKLGNLRKEYGFTMEDVRERIVEYQKN